MNIAKLKTFGLSCVYFLFVTFSTSASAADVEQLDSGLSVEAWSAVGSQDLPILSFDETQIHDDLYEDIRVENVIIEQDGSTRFQLSHSGPISRQVFANVRRVEQDDGFTRSIITNIADGHQMEFLTRTASEHGDGKFDKKSEGSLLTQMALKEGQNVECPWCPWLGALIAEATCAASMSIAHYQCRLDCQTLGGVKSFSSGICGMYNAECICMVDPKRINEEFGHP